MIVDATHDERVLIAMGANRVAEIRSDDGALTGYDVTPDIDMAGYAAALADFEEDLGPVPEKISDRQFFQQMAVEEKITQIEALAAVSMGTIPQAMDALIADLPESQQFPARMLVAGATEFLREHPVTLLIGQLYGFTPSDIDRIWREAARL